MASTITTVVGASSSSVPVGAFTPSAGSLHSAVSDSSDATYVENNNLALGVLAYNLPAPTLPARAVVQFIGIQMRRAVTAGANNLTPYYVYQLYASDSVGTQHSSTFAPGFTPAMAFNTSIQQHSTGPITNFSSGRHINDVVNSTLLLYLACYPAGVPATALRLYHIEVNWYYNSAPIITIPTLPANPTASSKPTAAWTYTDTEADPQTSARLIVVSNTLASATAPFGPPGSAGYVPQGGPPGGPATFDSGTVFTSSQSMQCTTSLDNGSTYYAYVQVAQNPDAGHEISSAWVGRQFLVTLTVPAVPTLAVTLNSASANSALVVREGSTATPHASSYDIQRSDDGQVSWSYVRDAQEASAALGWRNAGAASNGWSSPDNAAFTFQNGLDIRWFGALDDYTPAAIQTMAAQSLSTGSQQSWVFKLLTTGVLRLARSTSGTGAYINHDSTASVGTADGTDIGFRVVAVFNVNPITINFYRSIDNGANWIAVGTQVTAAGPSTILNSTANLNVGGYENLTLEPLNGLTRRVEFRNSAGTLVAKPEFEGQQYTVGPAPFVDVVVNTWTRLGSTAYMVMGLSVVDYEAPLGTAVRYRARSWKNDGTDEAAGAWVLDSGGPYTIAPTYWWLKDPLVPATNLVMSVRNAKPVRIKPQVKTQGIGASVATVNHSGMRGHEIAATFLVDGKAAYMALMALFDSGHTLLFQSVDGDNWYVQAGEQLDLPRIWALPTAAERVAGQLIRNTHEFTTTLIEVEAP